MLITVQGILEDVRNGEVLYIPGVMTPTEVGISFQLKLYSLSSFILKILFIVK